MARRCGVALLVRSRWAPHIKSYEAIEKRVAYTDIIGMGCKFRIVTAYYPHSGYRNDLVAKLYAVLAEVKVEAVKKRLVIVTSLSQVTVMPRLVVGLKAIILSCLVHMVWAHPMLGEIG